LNESIEHPQVDMRGTQILMAILALLADERKSRTRDDVDQTPTEVLLSEVGLDNATIAAILRKKPDAIRMAISRAKKAALKS